MLLFAFPPADARRKLAWLNTLKPLASNFMFTLSVILKIFDNVISAYQALGPKNVLRPRLPVHPRHGVERTGRFVCLLFAQPLAQVSRLNVACWMLESGRSLLPPSRL